jgi:hypothetical protein
MKTWVVVAAALALAGCSSDLITGGPLIRPGEPTGLIQVYNASGVPLHNVLISTCSASTYGLNRMSGGEAIPPGGTRDFVVSAGCWDVDAGSMGYGEARQRMQVAPRGMTRYTVH